MRKIKAFGCIVLVIAFVIVLSLASVPQVASGAYPTSEDLEYLEWSIATNDKLIEDGELITAEIKKVAYCDWEYLRVLAKLEYNHAKTALTEIDQFKVSPELEPIKTEKELHLIDTKWEAYYLREAAEAFLSGDYEGASNNLEISMEYLESSMAHSEKSLALIKALPKPTPTSTPKTPGYEAIFATGSLLSVAYLVLRRKNE